MYIYKCFKGTRAKEFDPREHCMYNYFYLGKEKYLLKGSKQKKKHFFQQPFVRK